MDNLRNIISEDNILYKLILLFNKEKKKK